MKVVYFSSKSNNTHRFVQKLACSNQRIPSDGSSILVTEDYILIVPTYAGGGDDTKGAVPKQVVQFLNVRQNRDAKGLFLLEIPILVTLMPLLDLLLLEN